MSQELINHSDDLKKLQNEGYELDVNNGYGIVSHIPYLKALESKWRNRLWYISVKHCF